MAKIDITMTATLRPDVLTKTLRGIVRNIVTDSSTTGSTLPPDAPPPP